LRSETVRTNCGPEKSRSALQLAAPTLSALIERRYNAKKAVVKRTLQAWQNKELQMSTMIASSNIEYRTRAVETLRATDRQVKEASGGVEALALMEDGEYSTLLLDRWLPDLEVEELSKLVKAQYPKGEVHIVNSDASETCPIGISAESSFCSYCGACGKNRDTCQIRSACPESIPANGSKPIDPLPGMVGGSCAMQQVYRLVRLVTARSTTVLLTRETGTGKELVARAIHQLGPCARQPMITLNCAAIPEALLEAELFGHARGAFTGAYKSRLGRIQSAHGGTLFLDEVGEVPMSVQVKLLRFLLEGKVRRLGSPDVIRVDVRVIVAINAELSKRVAEGRFREDIYYRLMVFPITLAPLRAHAGEILPLSNFFLNALCREEAVPPKTLSREAGDILKQYN
jgi:DNA-binding NtrC family response regulator